MEKKEQITKIESFLKENYDDRIDNQISLSKLIDANNSLKENAARVEEFLKGIIDKKLDEIRVFVDYVKFRELKEALFKEHEHRWNNFVYFEDNEIDQSIKRIPLEELNIYREDPEKMKEIYQEKISIYNSIDKGITAVEEINKFFEIAKLEFHLIHYFENKGKKYRFLQGFLKGLEWARNIVKNRSKNIDEQSKFSTTLEYYL